MGRKPSPHGGHRQRMRERFSQTGLTGFQPHEVLELILYGTIPLRDVNPLAHALIEHFGSVDDVMTASREELLSVSGVGERTADLIVCIEEMCAYYEAKRCIDRCKVTNEAQAIRLVQPLLRQDGSRELGVICQNGRGELIAVRVFPWPYKDVAGIRAALSMAMELNAHNVTLILSQPQDANPPQASPMEELFGLIFAMSSAEVYTLDILVLSNDRFTSLRKTGTLSDATRSFRDDDALMQSWLNPLDDWPSDDEWYIPGE